jgi:hypothetical protein
MATTKQAHYRFVVKEGPERMREVREGMLESFSDPFITMEHNGREPLGERPLKDPDFLAFHLREGISLDEAGRIADFLNEHLLFAAITRFGDAEDAARDVKQSESALSIDVDRFSSVLTMLKANLAASDIPGAVEALKAVEYVIADLIKGWSNAIATSRGILDAFGDQGVV